MKTTDWKFDFASLPRWENHNTIPFVYDEFFEFPQYDALCCIYSIAEVSMCNEIGFLAVIVNKEAPSLYFAEPQDVLFTPNVSISPDGKFVFLQASIYNRENCSYKRPIVIIDMSRKVFSYVHTDNTNTCYKISELTENVFEISADDYQKKHNEALKELCEQKIRTDRLEWYDLNSLREKLL